MLNYMDTKEICFYLSDSGLLHLRYKGEDFKRVAIIRMFPFQYEDEFISVRCENYTRQDKESEIGIIRDITKLEANQVEMVREELRKRYFIPDIIEVSDVKEEFGHTSWNVQTTAGKREFTVTDMSANVKNIGNNKIMMTDVYGNRYYIPDITKTDDKTMKILEIWI